MDVGAFQSILQAWSFLRVIRMISAVHLCVGTIGSSKLRDLGLLTAGKVS